MNGNRIPCHLNLNDVKSAEESVRIIEESDADDHVVGETEHLKVFLSLVKMAIK